MNRWRFAGIKGVTLLPVSNRRLKLSLAIYFGFLAFLPALAWFTFGKSHVEKVVTSLIMPLPLLWLFLLFLATICWGVEQRRMSKLFGWMALGLWIVANPTLSHFFMDRLENEVVPWNPDKDPPLDVVVVLGGGTGRDDSGRSQLTGAGDRVMWGARIYLTSRTKRLVTTGDPQPGIGGKEDDPADQTIELWTDLGIPPNAISTLSGINTYEELRSLKEQPELWDGKRVGVLTSAFHLPRAMRLAKRAGLEVIPISADDRAQKRKAWTLLEFLPSSGALSNLEMVLREKLAYWAGR